MKQLEGIVEKEVKRKKYSWNKILFQLLRLEMEQKVVKVSPQQVVSKKVDKQDLIVEEEESPKESLFPRKDFLTEFYRLEQRAFYQQEKADYESMYAHMGQAREYRTVAEAFASTGRKVSGQGDYERKGELTSQEAGNIVEKIVLAKMTGDFSRLSFAERERFCNWRMFNKSMRRMFEAATGYGGKKGVRMALV
tara:strand:- start:3906 stop:4487 length:582 start_codon:yes stop_codon:yes gene_type:complete